MMVKEVLEESTKSGETALKSCVLFNVSANSSIVIVESVNELIEFTFSHLIVV